jgi:hypothetical protein
VIPEIDIWRAANLMLKRYGDKALEESVTRVNELAAAGDDNGAANLAPDHLCCRTAREQHTARIGALIATSTDDRSNFPRDPVEQFAGAHNPRHAVRGFGEMSLVARYNIIAQRR